MFICLDSLPDFRGLTDGHFRFAIRRKINTTICRTCNRTY